ncbi:PIN domain nuclease [Granulicoccus sp. GXG6511]|uniref:PIN domain nuclease n=1 Tax=Granulicoccus sp. GXG6511 TaxID=3381351 RepID=UPI003D7CE608
MTSGWLIDKSAYARLGRSPDFELWLTRINRGLVHVSNLTLLELGFSATNSQTWADALESPPLALLMVEYLTPAMEDRALEVQQLLLARGQHRAPGIPDLVIAATAEFLGLAILHVDKDFELIASLTGQAEERLTGVF